MPYYHTEYSCETFIPLFTELRLRETEHLPRITELGALREAKPIRLSRLCF